VLGEVALFGMLGALTFGAKVAMSYLPNIEPVSLFVMLFAVVFGMKCLYPIYLYVLLEILVYGISTWNLNYLYVWAILAVSAYLMRRLKHPNCCCSSYRDVEVYPNLFYRCSPEARATQNQAFRVR
jgi:hypothetical protein